MNWDWQTIVALLFVAAAVGVLARSGVRLLRGGKTQGCGSGCGSCCVNDPKPAPKSDGFVSLESLQPPRNRSA